MVRFKICTNIDYIKKKIYNQISTLNSPNSSMWKWQIKHLLPQYIIFNLPNQKELELKNSYVLRQKLFFILHSKYPIITIIVAPTRSPVIKVNKKLAGPLSIH